MIGRIKAAILTYGNHGRIKGCVCYRKFRGHSDFQIMFEVMCVAITANRNIKPAIFKPRTIGRITANKAQTTCGTNREKTSICASDFIASFTW